MMAVIHYTNYKRELAQAGSAASYPRQMLISLLRLTQPQAADQMSRIHLIKALKLLLCSAAEIAL